VREDASIIGGLLRYADEVCADLIAVGSSGKGEIAGWLTGSVRRGLVTGAYCSVLVAKGLPRPDGPVHAVLATDHSAYVDECVQELLRLSPRGLSRLTIVTAYPAEQLEQLQLYVPALTCNLAESVERRLAEKNQALREHLAPLLGCEVDCRVAPGPVNDAIRACMAETQADLLILGAQGHGFWDRLTLGSVSFHQAFAEAYPVLILRARRG
jgi:nucleotide-binding universal stress UspA family protein